jgi:hypothetical protein
MTDSLGQGDNSPLIFLRPIGISAADAMRLMELARRLPGSVRWRMAPAGVSADAYLVHRHSMPASQARSSDSPAAGASNGQELDSDALIASALRMRKISLDHQGWYRGRPVCILGREADILGWGEDDLPPLAFPDALKELEHGLRHLENELIGSLMLYAVGSLAWGERLKWRSHRLHAIEGGQLLAVIDTQAWQFHLLDGCDVERMSNSTIVPMPRSGAFAAENFKTFLLEVALWEFAKRCPEAMLDHMLPSTYLTQALTHRRAPHLSDYAMGDHCVAILKALDTRSRTAQELEASLRMTRAALMRAITGLALIRAIQPESEHSSTLKKRLASWWARLKGLRS